MADDQETGTFTLAKMLAAGRDLGLFASPPALSMLERLPKPDPIESLFGPPLSSYLGIRLFKAPEYLYRQPDKPLRSRPRRTYVHARRKAVRAERVRLRGEKRRSARYWKGRRVPDRRGYSQNTAFFFNPNAVFLDCGE